MRSYCILQPAVFDCCPLIIASTHCADAGIQAMIPSISTAFPLDPESMPFLTTVRSYCFHQPTVFDRNPFTLASTHCADVGTQDIFPSVPTLRFRSTWDQCGDCPPLFVTVRFDCTLQLAVFMRCPATLASTHWAYAGIQDIVASPPTLSSHSTWNVRSNYDPIYLLLLGPLLLARIRNRTSQLCIFF